MGKLLRRALADSVGPEMAGAIETGIDVIGDIAIVKLDESVKDEGAAVGAALLASMKNVRVVYDQEGGLEGDFRLRKLRHLAGEERTVTVHKENGLRLKVDVEKCYFSPRLSTERMRIADLAVEGERALNMFAGVGPYSILLAKRKKANVWSCELNGVAYSLHVENNRLNKVEPFMHMYNEDAARLPEILDIKFDRILMPHPSRANAYLPSALAMISRDGWIHYYRHLSGADPAEAQGILDRELDDILRTASVGAKTSSRRVREIGPHFVELVADIHVTG